MTKIFVEITVSPLKIFVENLLENPHSLYIDSQTMLPRFGAK